MTRSAAIACVVWLSVAMSAADVKKSAARKPAGVQPPLGLVPLEWPADNPYSADKAELGRLLFYDKRLSKDETIACASCHSPERAFTDGAPNSEGIRGQHGNRSAPSVLNRAYSLAQFWDGRAPTLEEQVK